MKKYTYEDYCEGIESLSNNIKSVKTPFYRIVGVSRGGLVLGVRLSHILDIPFTPIVWSNHGDRESVPWLAEELEQGRRILLVDDIIDTGNTINDIINDWRSVADFDDNDLSVACAILNTAQEFMPDFFHKTIDREKNKNFIDFWWESK